MSAWRRKQLKNGAKKNRQLMLLMDCMCLDIKLTIKSRFRSTVCEIYYVSTIYQATYINALAVSVLPLFEPAKGTLGGFFFSVGGFFNDIE
jgi:hypothetical protein